MPESTTSDRAGGAPPWWLEIKDALANLKIVAVSVEQTGTATRPEWTVIVVLHVEHFHYWTAGSALPSRQDVCVAFPWVFGSRSTEDAAWKAAETFLRGLVAVREGTGARVPYIEREEGEAAATRLWQGVCSTIDRWHEGHHAVPTVSR